MQRSVLDGGNNSIRGFSCSLFLSLISLPPTATCDIQPKVLVAGKGYYVVVSKEWLDGWRRGKASINVLLYVTSVSVPDV